MTEILSALRTVAHIDQQARAFCSCTVGRHANTQESTQLKEGKKALYYMEDCRKMWKSPFMYGTWLLNLK